MRRWDLEVSSININYAILSISTSSIYRGEDSTQRPGEWRRLTAGGLYGPVVSPEAHHGHADDTIPRIIRSNARHKV